jgi:DNA-binding NarL/FixJ family response regulator
VDGSPANLGNGIGAGSWSNQASSLWPGSSYGRCDDDPNAPVNEAARRGWAQARGRFAALLNDRHEGDALEELGWAGWALGDGALTLRARERAFSFYRGAGDPEGAGRVASWLAVDRLEFRVDDVGARVWLERAHEAFDECPESVDHAWLLLVHADLAYRLDCDLPTMRALALRAGQLGRALRSADVEAVALGLEGLALAGLGAVADARPTLDAAAAIVASETMRMPFTAPWALACGVRAFEATGDVERFGRWCEAARVTAARSGLRHLLARARIAQGRQLTLTGDWAGAERELLAAVRDLRSARPGLAGPAYAGLGELRALQGREDEARMLLQQAGAHGLLGAGRLALAADDLDTALDCSRRALARLPGDAPVDRLPALTLLARAQVRLGDLPAGELTVTAVERAAAACASSFASGVARLLTAELASCHSDAVAARDAADGAVEAFEAAGAPYHAAQAHVALAAGLSALGRAGRAEGERAVAARTFEALGATGDLERLRLPPPLALAGLTTRETQVLRLIGEGRTDADVAERLALTPASVRRNLASLSAKLRLSSRSAASAYAERAGLV